jgi:ABC-type branched-subunit amino acid transport system substrate-binding protein
LSRFAALAPDTPYGRAVVAALRQAVARHGGEIVRVESYPPDSGELAGIVRQFTRYEARQAKLLEQRRELEVQDDDISREALKRLRNVETLGDADFDALLLPEGGPRLRALAPLFPYYDIDPKAVRFLGTGLWDEPGLGSEPAMVGAWFATTPPKESNAFRKRFETVFGRKPPRIASLGYDAIALAAALAQREPATPFSASALANPNGFSGYDGIFRFGRDNVIERGLAVIEIQSRGLRTVNPAPTTFQAPIN